MGILDIILLICFVPGIVQGITKGFIQQIISLVSIIVGAWLSSRFSARASEWMIQYLQIDSRILHIICFIVILVLTILLLNWAGILLTRVVKIALLGWVNVLLGILFSIIKTAVLLGLAIMFFDSINNSFHLIDSAKLADASVYCGLRSFATEVFPYLKSLIAHA